MVMVPPAASQITSERKMPMVPSVTMKGSMRPKVTIRPFARPQAALTAMAASMPSGERAHSPPPRLLRVRIIMPAVSAAMEPTERSSPPPAITKVAPTAMMAMKAERVTTFSRFDAVRKSGLMSAPAIDQHDQRDEGRERPHVDVELALVSAAAKHGFGHAWPAAISAALSS